MHPHADHHDGAARVEAALEQLRLGHPVVVFDDDDRENEGDLICAAELMTAGTMAFIVQHTSGLVCVGMTGERIDELGLPPMVEAAVELCAMAGLHSAGVLAEITNPDGTMARMPDLVRFARQHQLVLVSVADLVSYRMAREELVSCTAAARVPTDFGDFTAATYRSEIDGTEHLAFIRGHVTGKADVLVRVHSECLTGDVLGSRRCDCGERLQLALERVAQEDQGVVLYLRGHEGRGIGLTHKLRAYQLQDDDGLDTVDANLALDLPVDSREYGVGAQILRDLGVSSIRLMSNNPAKFAGLSNYGITISERVPLRVTPNVQNAGYLQAKSVRLDHDLDAPRASERSAS